MIPRPPRLSAARMVASRPTCWAAPLLLLAACSSPEDTQDEASAPAPVLTGNPVMAQAVGGEPMTAGAWVIGEDAMSAHARFGEPGSEPVFAMECDVPSQALALVRGGDDITAEDQQTFILEAGGLKASVDMAPTGGDLPLLGAEINKAMPIFQAFTPLANVITVTGPDGSALRMQGAPGIQRVIEACSRF